MTKPMKPTVRTQHAAFTESTKPALSAKDETATATPSLPRRRLLLGATAAAGAGLAPAFLRAQSAGWPNRSVRVVVPFPPGGLTDAYARVYSEHLQRKFGQSFVIDNKTGAGGTLGAGEVAKAAPDGYTLVVSTSGPLWQAKALYKKLNYTPVKDFEPIALFPSGALIVGVHDKVPARNAREFINQARSNKSAAGTYGAGSWAHMIADVWSRSEKLDLVVAHYRGETPMWVDVASGQVQMAVGSVQGVLPHIQRGVIRPIGATGRVRTPRLPDVPTLVEQGFTAPVFGMEGYLPFAAPAGTPRDILDKLAEGIREASATPRLKELREQFGIPNVPLATAAEVRKEWDSDSAEWITLATQLGISLD